MTFSPEECLEGCNLNIFYPRKASRTFQELLTEYSLLLTSHAWPGAKEIIGFSAFPL
jgi:hypothetical protein